MAQDSVHRIPVRGNAFSFFTARSLNSIEEVSQNSKSMASSDMYVENGSSTHENVTALPQWDPINTPKRTALSRLPSPNKAHTRPHTRQGSQDPILDKDIFIKDKDFGPGDEESRASTPGPTEKPRQPRMVLWLILAVVTIIALAVVLGAILGTFLGSGRNSGHGPSVTEIPAGTPPEPSSTPGQAPTLPTPSSQLTSIGVSGWSVPGEEGYYVSWVVTQSLDGYLNRHTFNSSTGNWTRVSKFAKGKLGTPIGVASLRSAYYEEQPTYHFLSIQYQTSVVYLDDNNYLQEWIFPDTGPAEGKQGPLSSQKYIAHEKTKIAFYWPRLVYQGLSGEVREAYYECYRKNLCWHDRVLATTKASNGTQLVTLPMLNELGMTSVFYQEERGRVVSYQEQNNDQEPALWSNGAFPTSVPRGSPMAAFSTVRVGLSDESKFNSYLLWQDANNTVQMSWSQNEGGWKGPRSFQAFAGAVNNTAMACLTGITFPKFPLPAGTDLSRCYFQSGAAVREVNFNGAGWNVVGNVPVEV